MKWSNKYIDVAVFAIMGICATITSIVQFIDKNYLYSGVLGVGAIGLGLLVYHSFKNNWDKT